MCDKVISKVPFMLKYCLDRYKTQEMSDKADAAFLPTLTFGLDWYFWNETLEKLSNDDIDLDDMNSDIAKFFSDARGLHTINLSNNNPDDDNFDDDNSETIIHIRLMTWCNR